MNDNADAIVFFALAVGWIGMLAGAVSGAICGLFFHREDWMGGYGSYRRRLARLGHIACFGVGFLNILFALTHQAIHSDKTSANIAFWGFMVGMVSMPMCCFLSAWKKPFRHLFPIPVIAIAAGILGCLTGLFNHVRALL